MSVRSFVQVFFERLTGICHENTSDHPNYKLNSHSPRNEAFNSVTRLCQRQAGWINGNVYTDGKLSAFSRFSFFINRIIFVGVLSHMQRNICSLMVVSAYFGFCLCAGRGFRFVILMNSIASSMADIVISLRKA